MKYRLTKKAVQGLNQIWNYTFDEWSEKQADKYYFDLIGKCESIADDPALGKPYSTIFEGLLGLRVHKHIIFYRELGSEPIEIIRILHSSMDLKSRIVE